MVMVMVMLVAAEQGMLVFTMMLMVYTVIVRHGPISLLRDKRALLRLRYRTLESRAHYPKLGAFVGQARRTGLGTKKRGKGKTTRRLSS